ncbi:outer membrane beta-barrel protein [Ekhidna sp.]|uniref:outer membrane beta-barrel protein n=1 Tax=Ekhidna sp. TaxID=2608089 RepID=UPI003C7AE7F4
MKKITILTLFAAFLLVGISANAQEQGEIRVGAGLALGTKAAIDDDGSEKMGIGINIGGEYFVTDVISVAPSYTFFFKSEIEQSGQSVSIQYGSLNIDGRYYFGDGMFYGLAGLSFASGKSEFDFGSFGGSGSETDSEVGLNIGGGVMYPLSDGMFLNGQVKYNTPIEQLVINAGVAFTIGG